MSTDGKGNDVDDEDGRTNNGWKANITAPSWVHERWWLTSTKALELVCDDTGCERVVFIVNSVPKLVVDHREVWAIMRMENEILEAVTLFEECRQVISVRFAQEQDLYLMVDEYMGHVVVSFRCRYSAPQCSSLFPSKQGITFSKFALNAVMQSVQAAECQFTCSIADTHGLCIDVLHCYALQKIQNLRRRNRNCSWCELMAVWKNEKT